jgi:hypothetical protein
MSDDFDWILDYGDGGAGDYLVGNILGDDNEIETAGQITPRSIRKFYKRKTEIQGQQDSLRDILQTYPAPNESVHVLSAAKFNFWTCCPVMVDWIGATEDLYISTWTANRNNVVELFQLFDAKKITGRIIFITGLYFKSREPAVFAMLAEGLLRRGGKLKAFENHAKVMLLNNAECGVWLSIEGSANLTSNPRLEQFVITNDKDLHNFHASWMQEALELKTKIPFGGRVKRNQEAARQGHAFGDQSCCCVVGNDSESG